MKLLSTSNKLHPFLSQKSLAFSSISPARLQIYPITFLSLGTILYPRGEAARPEEYAVLAGQISGAHFATLSWYIGLPWLLLLFQLLTTLLLPQEWILFLCFLLTTLHRFVQYLAVVRRLYTTSSNTPTFLLFHLSTSTYQAWVFSTASGAKATWMPSLRQSMCDLNALRHKLQLDRSLVQKIRRQIPRWRRGGRPARPCISIVSLASGASRVSRDSRAKTV